MVGKLVAFEGLDGSGKTTIAREFEVKLWEIGTTNTMLTHEPFEKAVAGEWIRAALRKEFEVAPRLMAQAFALNRLDHIRGWIQPALDEGKVVVCDRYIMSSKVYNSTMGTKDKVKHIGIDVDTSDIEEFNMGYVVPDVTFFLHATEATCLERLAARGKPTELYEDKLEEYSNRYLMQVDVARRYGRRVHMIDADAPLDNVMEQVMAFWVRSK